MKKAITIFLIISALLFLNINVNAQSFEKGSVNFDLGIGIGVYVTSQTTKLIGTSNSSSKTIDRTASLIVPISFEYGISEKIGLGADLTINNYVINDDDKAFTSSIKAFDFGLKFNYHILNSDRNELFLGFGFGFSSINWDLEPNTNQLIESFSGSGVYWSIGVTDRIFFSDHIGILFNINYKGYSYSGLKANFTPEGEASINSFGFVEPEIGWILNGVNIGVGLAIKF